MRIPVRKQVMWWGIAALTLLVTLWLLGQAVLPFILGAGIAYLLDPLADRLERAGLSRTMSVVVITFAVVLAFVAIALRSVRFWPLWVSGLQLTTVMAHGLRLIRPDLVDLAYAAAMRFWSYPILLILVVAALRSDHYRPEFRTHA